MGKCKNCHEWIDNDLLASGKQDHLDGKCCWYECFDCPINGDDCEVCNNEGGVPQ